MASPIQLLKKVCQTDTLTSDTALSADGKTLTILGSAHDATASQTLTLHNGKEASYTLASIYLLLLNPSTLPYRKACDAGGVTDPVKILDKDSILDYFPHGGGEDADADDGSEDKADDDDDAMDMSEDDESAASAEDDARKDGVHFSQPQPASEEKRGQAHGKEHRRSGRDKKRDRGGRGKDREGPRSRSPSKARKEEEGGRGGGRKGGGRGPKAPKGPITNEQLVANLSTIVDKRDKAGPGTGAGAAPLPSEERADGAGAADDRKDAREEAKTTTPVDARQITPAATPFPVDGEEREGATSSLSNQNLELQEKEDRELLLSWLSPAGFQGSDVAAAIEADREAVRQITALEIPVGDSASILRAGAGGEVLDRGAELNTTAASPGGANVRKRDFARALDIYQEVAAAEERERHRAASGKGRRKPPPPPPRARPGGAPRAGASDGETGNPIIVVPNAMTSAITMVNVQPFLGDASVFIPRDQALKDPAAGKRGGTLRITRRLSARFGGHEVTYDVIDNPATRLGRDEWRRVVAVVCQGASWQFKGWRYSDPVDLFSRTFGFYVGMEGAGVPDELRGWKVRIGKVSRDRRGMDSRTTTSFWNGLEEFMAVHKQEFLK